jgi:hypothetical protein
MTDRQLALMMRFRRWLPLFVLLGLVLFASTAATAQVTTTTTLNPTSPSGPCLLPYPYRPPWCPPATTRPTTTSTTTTTSPPPTTTTTTTTTPSSSTLPASTTTLPTTCPTVPPTSTVPTSTIASVVGELPVTGMGVRDLLGVAVLLIMGGVTTTVTLLARSRG